MIKMQRRLMLSIEEKWGHQFFLFRKGFGSFFPSSCGANAFHSISIYEEVINGNHASINSGGEKYR